MFVHNRLSWKQLCVAIVGSCACWNGGVVAVESQVSPTLMAIVSAYEESLEPYQHIKVTWMVESCGHQRADAPQLSLEFTVFRDLDSVKVAFKNTRQQNKKSNIVDYEDVCKKGMVWQSVYPGGILFSKIHVPASDFVERMVKVPPAPSYGFIGYKWIPDFLKTSKLSAEEEIVNGRKSLLLCGVSDQISIMLQLNPSLGYAAQRITYSNSHPTMAAPEREINYEVRNFKKIGSTWVPTEATLTISMPTETLAGNKETIGNSAASHLATATKSDSGNNALSLRKDVCEIRLVNIDFSPAFTADDFKLSLPIANGTKVYMKDALHLNYVWQDGKVVPGLDTATLAAARGAGFVGTADPSRRWMVVFSILLLLIVLITVLVRRQMAKHRRYNS